MDNYPTSGQAYMHVLLNKWEEVMGLGENFRNKYLLQAVDQETAFIYIAKLTRLWGELYPKIQDRKDLGDLEERFKAFQPYYYDPRQLTNPDKAEDIFKLEMMIREALEKVKVLAFEG